MFCVTRRTILQRHQILRPYIFRTHTDYVRLDQVRQPKTYKKLRRTALSILGLGVVSYGIDSQFNANAIERTLRTLWICALISADYKINFTQENTDQIPLIHQRVADRMFHLFTTNGGLYIKIGQAIGANAALLPKPMQEKFARLFDDAPQVSYAIILDVFKREFNGRPPAGPGGVFAEFEHTAVASASIAQVHRAITWDGKQVAVKIQKPDVSKQVSWDLGAYRWVMWCFQQPWAFDLPVYFVVDFVVDHLKAELDFEQEAENARRTAELISNEPSLASKVYIPMVFPEYSTKQIMTAEWIDGVRLSDRSGIRKLMGESGTSSPAIQGGTKAVMKTMVELFSVAMFKWGWVHCDPHPGNIIIRESIIKPGMPQLVLIDHGLYVSLSPAFRRQYATLWKSLLAVDYSTIEEITQAWGIGAPDLFASATLLKPMKFRPKQKGKADQPLSQYEQSLKMKAKLRSFLTDTDKMPKELVFLGRNMRMVQGNNQAMGSPVNRIKITGYWAAKSLVTNYDLTFRQRAREYWYHASFRVVMLSLDVAFWASQVRVWIRAKFGYRTTTFEDELEKTMRGFAQNNLGVEVAEGVFDG